jgi:hypothetical protein
MSLVLLTSAEQKKRYMEQRVVLKVIKCTEKQNKERKKLFVTERGRKTSNGKG